MLPTLVYNEPQIRGRPRLETKITSPMPGDPKDMTAVQARAAARTPSLADITLGTTPDAKRALVTPNEQAAYDACIANGVVL